MNPSIVSFSSITLTPTAESENKEFRVARLQPYSKEMPKNYLYQIHENTNGDSTTPMELLAASGQSNATSSSDHIMLLTESSRDFEFLLCYQRACLPHYVLNIPIALLMNCR